MSTTFAKPYIPEKFPMQIAGDFGTFFTDSNAPVFYLNTSFNIDDIQYIKPVREILDVSEVDFDELVQRDLDDFRIKRDIINYLVDKMGYKFFPPIVVAITQPDENKNTIKNNYPALKTRIITVDKQSELEIEFENAFSIKWFLDNDDKIISLPTVVRWKPDKTHLMAVDGQHRLVALQAVRGLLKNENLKLFYSGATEYKSKLDHIKVPVTILIFPNCAEKISENDLQTLKNYFPNNQWNLHSQINVKRVLRNIFVDVNKTARQPSRSRTILLDEKDLTAVFSRLIFSAIKDEKPKIYSALLEYNAPSGKEVQIEKGRATITTIGIVYAINEYLFKDGSAFDEGASFRTRLEISNVEDFPSSEEFPKDKIKSTEFSLEQRVVSEKLFNEKWLYVFKELFINLLPYKTLTSAMESAYNTYLSEIEKQIISENDYEIFSILFGGNEKRFVLENLAKIKSNTSKIILYRKLKEREKQIRDSVNNFELFYSLMFQLGFFQSISLLISNNIFRNSYYIERGELDYVISTLNSFISENSKNSILSYENPINNLIFRGKASKENSILITQLITLILLNYKRANTQNLLLKNVNPTEEVRNKITNECLSMLRDRIMSSLRIEFEATTENKIRWNEIQLEKETDSPQYKLSLEKYSLDQHEYALNTLATQEQILKKTIHIEN